MRAIQYLTAQAGPGEKKNKQKKQNKKKTLVMEWLLTDCGQVSWVTIWFPVMMHRLCSAWSIYNDPEPNIFLCCPSMQSKVSNYYSNKQQPGCLLCIRDLEILCLILSTLWLNFDGPRYLFVFIQMWIIFHWHPYFNYFPAPSFLNPFSPMFSLEILLNVCANNSYDFGSENLVSDQLIVL